MLSWIRVLSLVRKTFTLVKKYVGLLGIDTGVDIICQIIVGVSLLLATNL